MLRKFPNNHVFFQTSSNRGGEQQTVIWSERFVHLSRVACTLGCNIQLDLFLDSGQWTRSPEITSAIPIKGCQKIMVAEWNDSERCNSHQSLSKFKVFSRWVRASEVKLKGEGRVNIRTSCRGGWGWNHTAVQCGTTDRRVTGHNRTLCYPGIH